MKGVCKLCCKHAELKHSHIVPDFYIRSLEERENTGSHGIAQPTSIALSTRADFRDGPKQRGYWEKRLGLKEYLLCEECEGKFQKLEIYARHLFYGNSPAPLKKLILGESIFVEPIDKTGKLLDVRDVTVDYAKIKLYQMSLLWRASVATGEFFRTVNLGAKHEAKLQQFLVRCDPSAEDEYPCVIIDLRYEDGGCEDHILQTTAHRDDQGQRIYSMILGGFQFLYSVSAHQATEVFQNCSVRPNGKMRLLVGNAEVVLQKWATLLKDAGKLKTR